MNSSSESQPPGAPLGFLAGGGEMGERIRVFDWAKTPIGSPESWSTALRTVVQLMLANRLPMLLWWGPEYISIYNDPYRTVLGNKHPWGLGLPVRECWREVWHILQPLIDTPFRGGPATWNEDIQLVINRYGFPEETHWLIAYSPVPDETVASGIGGVLATVNETTDKVLSERRMTALRDLASRPADAKSTEEACRMAAATLASHAADIPFAMFYLLDADGQRATLAATVGVDPTTSICQSDVHLNDSREPWPFAEARRTAELQVVTDLAARFATVPVGPWPEAPTTAVVLPIASGKPQMPQGFLVLGASSRLRLDEGYRSFLELVAAQVATALSNARAFEAEKHRAESLAELDRAKTMFFSNVSHEFRTPLTLILGPLDDAVTKADESQRDRLLTVKRNALRLQKLVNTLLDFSRIEAGRTQASFRPVSLAEVTSDLAGNFRAACEAAGLKLNVDCPALTEPAYVDVDMWEKIILNLLSNAFKFTWQGRISVRLEQAERSVRLLVSDSGVGIPADQMPRLFERFERVEGVVGRSQEGSGIGLALVRELVRLHGGEVTATSELGRGTTFVVTIPLGKSHLAEKQVAQPAEVSTPALGTRHYVEEANRWIAPDTKLTAHEDLPLILLADDNADMRQHLQHVLAQQYRVDAVSDGQAALVAIERAMPELVLTDVMMPKLDGFGLLRALRANPRTNLLPVVMLTARAGEESQIVGLEAGADDYLVKPFTSRELLARVGAHIQFARLRKEAGQAIRESEERFRAFVSASSDVIYRMSADWREMRLLEGRDFIPSTTSPSQTWLQKYIHPDDQARVKQAIAEAIRTQQVFELEHRVLRVDGTPGWTFSRAIPILDARGEILE